MIYTFLTRRLTSLSYSDLSSIINMNSKAIKMLAAFLIPLLVPPPLTLHSGLMLTSHVEMFQARADTQE